jgi:peptidoglycan/xylan/chitin deacetylase (PgdA/CDA1 family)
MPCLAAGLLLLSLVSCGSSEDDGFILLEGVEGPALKSEVSTETPFDWRMYSEGAPSRLAVLLLDEHSAWAGLVSGFSSLGIPFRITDDISAALEHDVVYVYPHISGLLSDDKSLGLLEEFVAAGGTLLSGPVLSAGARELFGFADLQEGRGRAELLLASRPGRSFPSGPREERIRIGNPDRLESLPGSYAYLSPENTLAEYEDGGAAIIQSFRGEGMSVAFGFDLGFHILKAINSRHDSAYRSYVNGYEPSVDLLLRLVMALYRQGEPDAARLWGVPEGKSLALIVSHDVDYAGSLANAPLYAEVEQEHGVSATYFMQTKYYRDYFDEVFFDDRTEELLAQLDRMGMEIGSHSVSHTDMLAQIPTGSGSESYPDYQPRVRGMGNTADATLLGELRVSKHLLQELSSQTVVSFRPGFLANPFELAQALEAAGYLYSSSVTANNVLSHLPFRMTWNRGYGGFTGVYEFPVTLEDEKDSPMDGRVDEAVALAEEIASYGGIYVVLIHPDITGHKLEFLKKFLPRVAPFSWSGSLREYGEFWTAREAVELDILQAGEDAGTRILTLRAPRAISGLTVLLPEVYTLAEVLKDGRIEGRRLILDEFSGERRILFAVKERP